MENNNKWFRWLYRSALILIIALIIFVFIQLTPIFAPFSAIFKALVLPLGVSVLIAYLLHPIVEKLHEVGMSRTVAVMLLFLLMIGLFALIAMIGFPELKKQIEHFVEVVPEQVQMIEQATDEMDHQLHSLPEPIQLQVENWKDQLIRLGEHIFSQVEAVFLFLVTSFFALIVIPFLVFYLLKDYDQIQRICWYVTPRRWRKPLQRFIKDVDQAIGGFIRGQLLVSLLVGVMSTLGLWLLGVPYPILLGVFIGALDLIPFFGPYIGAAPAVIVSFLESWQLGLFTILLLFIIQQLESNILSPVIVGKSIHLHPVLIILALLVGVEIGGFLGMLLAVPLLAIGKVVFLHIRSYRLAR
ncbi:AI-2E family transporter [Halalkalibacter sp. AB-rgal2]|uniref:AI-2E family transporter n=1 Tax=Halalkalibacter sp. AB-rgal2 TaxID=3242695 RepID=UPI00359DBCAC